MSTDIDYLCIGNSLLAKAKQPACTGDGRLREFNPTCEGAEAPGTHAEARENTPAVAEQLTYKRY